MLEQHNRLRCSLLLELEDKNLERLFWQDADTIKAYIYWDTYISINQLASNLIIGKMLLPALTDTSVLRYTWHMHANVIANVLSCALNLLLIFRHRGVYARNRHSIIFAQRMLRIVWMLMAVVQSSDVLQATVARAVNKAAADDTALPPLGAAIMNLTRPLFVAPIINMAHASWVFRTKLWLPIQVLTTLLSIFGAQRHQHCRMAADPSSALLLQPACRGVSELHMYVAGSMLGPLLYLLRPLGFLGATSTACSSMTLAAGTLTAYAQAAYGMLFPFMGFCTLEWRAKAKWAREKLGGRQLAYGPLGWPVSEGGPKSFSSVLQSLLTWVLSIAICLWLLWFGCALLIPRIGVLPCQTCQDKGTCRPVAPCDTPLCGIPGQWTAAVVYLQMLFVLLGHLLVTRFV